MTEMTHEEQLRDAVNRALYRARTERAEATQNINKQIDVAFNALCRVNEELQIYGSVLPVEFLENTSGYINDAFNLMKAIGRKNPSVTTKKADVDTILAEQKAGGLFKRRNASGQFVKKEKAGK